MPDQHIEDYEEPSTGPAEYPHLVTLAGYVWMTLGAVILSIVMAVLFLSLAGLLTTNRTLTPWDDFVEVFGLCFVPFLVGVVLVSFGRKGTRGTDTGMVSNGVISVIFSLFGTGVGLLSLRLGLEMTGSLKPFAIGFGILTAVSSSALLAAGVMALAGARPYKAWRQDQQPKNEKHANGQ